MFIGKCEVFFYNRKFWFILFSMSDIFLSYASADRERVRLLVRALERHGWSVWWDRTILPGRTFDQAIEEALGAVRCMIVVWSQHSVNSDWVKTEAAEGARRRILVPVLLDEVRLPLEFRRIQTARLLDWHETGAHPEFDKVVQAVSHFLRPPSLTAEETLASEAATPIRSPPNPAAPGEDRPCGAAPRREEAATPSVSATDQPAGYRPTTSNTPVITERSRRHKHWRLWVGGVLLGVLVTATYLALSGRTPSSPPQLGPTLAPDASPGASTAPVPVMPPALGVPSELLVGTWRFTGEELGRPMNILWHLRPDGTETYIVNGVPQGTGTWQYIDAHIYERHPDGRQGKGAIQILDRNHLVVTIVDNGFPAYTGLQRLYVRQ
jgi:hypothetical protein